MCSIDYLTDVENGYRIDVREKKELERAENPKTRKCAGAAVKSRIRRKVNRKRIIRTTIAMGDPDGPSILSNIDDFW